MVFYAVFNSISVISRRQLTLFMSSWVSPVLGWGSEVSCPRTLPRKNPEDQVWLQPRTPGLQVKHFTTEPCRTLLPFGQGFLVLMFELSTSRVGPVLTPGASYEQLGRGQQRDATHQMSKFFAFQLQRRIVSLKLDIIQKRHQ